MIFHAVVVNDKDQICLLPEDAKAFFLKHNLISVPMTSLGMFNKFETLCEFLLQRYEKVANGFTQAWETGAVYYFVVRCKGKTPDYVASLGKISNFEHRAFK